jgi:hypothetical protein
MQKYDVPPPQTKSVPPPGGGQTLFFGVFSVWGFRLAKLKNSFTVATYDMSWFSRHPTRVCSEEEKNQTKFQQGVPKKKKKKKKKKNQPEILRSGENLKKKSTTTFVPLWLGMGLIIFFEIFVQPLKA